MKTEDSLFKGKTIEDSKTVVQNGIIKLYSLNDFINEIVDGNCCFICGANPEEKTFNDEHVIPDWILRRYNLYGGNINLTNGTFLRYGQYKIPCCEECNSSLGRTYV